MTAIVRVRQNEILISVLIPTYNRVTTLEQCVRSAQAGGYDRLEIIISDNASTDGTQELARRLAAEDPRIVFLEHAKNLGPLPNWRACLERATGDYVHWLWSDDWVEPAFYRTLMDGLDRYQAQVAIAAARITNPEEGWWYIANSFPNRPIPKDQWMRRMLAGSTGPVSPAAALLPIESCRRHFTNSIPVHGDIDCNRRAIGCDALMIIGAIHDNAAVYSHPDPLVNFRAHSGSITMSSGNDIIRTHYAWARLQWRKMHGYSRSHVALDVARLIASHHFIAAMRGIL